MSARPTFIDLPLPPSLSENNSARSSPRDRPSPRLLHLAGDVPPPMSPLDAFAAQSRLLAKQLDDSRRNGRRASRLPPLAVANTLGKPRPGYFRAQSGESEVKNEEAVSATSTEDDKPGLRMEVEEPLFRPQSYYPRMSNMTDAARANSPFGPPSGLSQVFSTPLEQPSTSKGDYFGTVRAPSPEPMASGERNFEAKSPSIRTHGSSISSHHQTDRERGLSIESQTSHEDYPEPLLPPKPAFARHASSIRSVSMESSDDDNMGPSRDSTSQARKFSSASAVSLPYAPQSPIASYPRPPSITSEYSVASSRLNRPYNFSRPLSHSSRPSMEFPRGKESLESTSSMGLGNDIDAPQSVDVPTLDPLGSETSAEPSYTYAKFSLPRGRMLNRGSTGLETIPMPVFSWEEQPKVETNVISATPPPASLENPIPSIPTTSHSIPSDDQASVSTFGETRTSSDSQHSTTPSEPPLPNPSSPKGKHKQSSPSVNSGSTIKASSARTVLPANPPNSYDLSAEDHLQKGIACHEAGALQESTYHLRLAAKRNNPTAMLLYALACRHGWGMRANPTEAVQWLRKAMDCASIELAEDTALTEELSPGQKAAKKARKAQFALSIYELGQSHMHGWGIEPDKSLALRCFEIAGEWGDADAMTEAGFCYAKGVGCKVDKGRAARWYLRAEKAGISMIGNSWIYKAKYAEDRRSDERSSRKDKAVPGSSPEKDRKSRNLSRSRGIFGRKRSVAAGT